MTGLTSARGHRNRADDLVTKIGSLSDGRTQYTAAIAYNGRTGRIDGAILPVQLTDDGSPDELGQPNSAAPNLYDIDNAVLESVRDAVFERRSKNASTGNTVSTASNAGTVEQDPQLWDQLRESAETTARDRTETPSEVSASATEGPSLASEETLLDNIVKEIAAGAKDAINRVGAYYIKSPKGTRCTASVNRNRHHQLGTSIDYEDDLGALGSTVIGAALGAVIGGIATTLPGAVVGAVVGAVAGFAIDRLKDSSNVTMAIRDRDSCFRRYCVPGMRPYVSGVWMDQNTDLLRVNRSPDLPAVHLENGSRVNPGYRDVVRISP